MCRLPHVWMFAITISMTAIADASQDSIGANGINSAGLLDASPQPQPLTGAGIGIGQVEPERPGKPIPSSGTDDAAHSTTTTVPTAVFLQDGSAVANMNISDHAEGVAGVMISTDTNTRGVATAALLFSSSDGDTGPEFDEHDAITAQFIGTRNGGDIRAINMSFGNQLTGGHSLDGNSLLTQFVDWSAAHDDTLYVIAGNEGAGGIPVPTDNFNGITVGASAKIGGVGMYRQVASFNNFAEDADGPRTSIGIIAPGRDIEMLGMGDFPTPNDQNDGTSFAAPHVTGTVALLQQYAEQKITAGAWGANARRHEVMKTVLMNSADKLIDDNTVVVPGDVNPVPTGYLLGMQRTVVRQNGTSTWFDSPAYDDSYPEGSGVSVPLDLEMGAGHLNAARALQQFQTGEYNSDGARVPVLGWDYGHTDGITPIPDRNHYVLNQQLQGDSFIAITLAWDRDVGLDIDGGTPNRYDVGDTFTESNDFYGMAADQINDLDLYLAPYNGMGTMEPIAYSFSPGNLEHLFFRIPTTDQYEFWVEQADEDISGGQDYAIAWWAVGTGNLIAADFDDDLDVDARDIDILWSIVRGTGTDPNDDDTADLNGDGLVNEDDVDYMLAGQLTAGTNIAYGDANLSGGTPELTDYNLWRTGTGGWAAGDFDGSGGTPELNDYNLWRTGPTIFPGSIGEHGGGGSIVPEPASALLMGLGLPVLALAARRRMRRH